MRWLKFSRALQDIDFDVRACEVDVELEGYLFEDNLLRGPLENEVGPDYRIQTVRCE